MNIVDTLLSLCITDYKDDLDYKKHNFDVYESYILENIDDSKLNNFREILLQTFCENSVLNPETNEVGDEQGDEQYKKEQYEVKIYEYFTEIVKLAAVFNHLQYIGLMWKTVNKVDQHNSEELKISDTFKDVLSEKSSDRPYSYYRVILDKEKWEEYSISRKSLVSPKLIYVKISGKPSKKDPIKTFFLTPEFNPVEKVRLRIISLKELLSNNKFKSFPYDFKRFFNEESIKTMLDGDDLSKFISLISLISDINSKSKDELINLLTENMVEYSSRNISGGKKSKKLPKKEILGKMRCIYKIPGDRKEYLKHKGKLITVKEYKELMKVKPKKKEVKLKKVIKTKSKN